MNEIKTLYFESVTSTNDIVREYDRPWTVAFAEEQSAGRGQRGNSWESEKGKNLILSLLVKPTFLHVTEQFRICEFVSLAVVQALDYHGIKAQIKWPNDIYVENRKICGILIEHDISSEGHISRSVIGLGLNVNQKEFTSDAPNPTSCTLEVGKEIDRKVLLATLYDRMYDLYGRLEGGGSSEIDELYKQSLYRMGVRSQFTSVDEGTFEGTIQDVRPSGELIVCKDSQDCRGYLFKEINFII